MFTHIFLVTLIFNFTMSGFAELDRIQASELINELEDGESLNYDQVIIIGDLNLGNSDGISKIINSSITITNSEVQGAANSQGTIFTNAINFGGTSFRDDVSFNDVKFLDDVSMEGCRFEGDTYFFNSTFVKKANFLLAEFINNCYFTNDHFLESAIFSGDNFLKDANFAASEFGPETYFISSNFYRYANFDSARFNGEASFEKALFAGEAEFYGVEFVKDVKFIESKFYEEIFFQNVFFNGKANFRDSIIQNANFEGSTFNMEVNFLRLNLRNSLKMDNTKMYTLNLQNIAFGKDSFLSLSGCDYSKIFVRWDSIKDHILYDGSVYLGLVKNFNNLEYFNDADNCYYQYRKISQGLKGFSWSKIGDIFVWLFCGYGVRPSFALSWIIGIIIAFSALYWVIININSASGKDPKISVQYSLLDSLIDSLYTSMSIFLGLSSDFKLSGKFKFLVILERLSGWLFLALFLITLGKVMIR